MGAERGVAIVEGGVGFGHSTFTVLLQDELVRKGITPQVISPRTDADATTQELWNLAATGYHLAAQNEHVRQLYEQGRNNSDGSRLLSRTRRGLESRIPPNAVVVSDHAYASFPSGFFVPPELKNAQSQFDRESRIGSGQLHVSFLTSGAYPKAHIDLLRKRILPSLADEMKPQRRKLQLSVYTGTNRDLALAIVAQSIDLGISTILNDDDAPDGKWGVRVCYSDTAQKAIRTSFTLAEQSDLVITMANERAGWIGAGVPLALLMPIGLNAQSNTKYLLDHRLAISPSAMLRGDEGLKTLCVTQGKSLKRMQSRAKGMNLPVNGAENTAQLIYQAVS